MFVDFFFYGRLHDFHKEYTKTESYCQFHHSKLESPLLLGVDDKMIDVGYENFSLVVTVNFFQVGRSPNLPHGTTRIPPTLAVWSNKSFCKFPRPLTLPLERYILGEIR